MSDYNAKCFCGAVEFSVRGEPVAMGVTANRAATGPPDRSMHSPCGNRPRCG